MATSRDPLRLGMELPFSSRNEVRYFFSKGIPLAMTAFMNSGVPPLFAMIIAGHTKHSAQLQASLGYGRVWYNCTCLMPMASQLAYMQNSIPGCIGAGRKDRIPRYLQRSLLMSVTVMIPFFALQFVATSLMKHSGVPAANAEDVGIYCKTMLAACLLNLFNSHLECIFLNFGYAKYATLISFASGMVVHMSCTYLFILKWNMGIEGAALAQIAVQCTRTSCWIFLLLHFRLFGSVCVAPSGAECLFNQTESQIYASLAIPQLFSSLAGWFIFELQMIAMANISGINQEALAAGAAWVQFEGSLASTQEGWLKTTSMRILVLLGQQDPGARNAFVIFSRLTAFTVAVFNVFLLIFQQQLCAIVSNNADVQSWFRVVAWVLVFHTQTRIIALNSIFIFIPVGKGKLRVIYTFVSFYFVATPISGMVALTDLVTTDLSTKMVACVGATSIAQSVLAMFCFRFIHKLDWDAAGAIINQRANTDRVSLAILATELPGRDVLLQSAHQPARQGSSH